MSKAVTSTNAVTGVKFNWRKAPGGTNVSKSTGKVEVVESLPKGAKTRLCRSLRTEVVKATLALKPGNGAVKSPWTNKTTIQWIVTILSDATGRTFKTTKANGGFYIYEAE